MTIEDYLTGPGAAPWRWGVLDCVMFANGWVTASCGLDPAAPLRGRYATRSEVFDLIEAAGGLVALIGPEMARVGLARTDTPESGDVGVVEIPIDADGTVEPAAAIRCGPWWLARGIRGLAGGDYRCLAAWSIPKA